MKSESVLSFHRVSKIYDDELGGRRYALRDVSFELERGVVAVVGRSGSGKSTLLHLAAGIDLPSQGEVRIGAHNLATLSEAERTRVRRSQVGLVFQFFYLLPHLSVLENVVLPELIAGGRDDFRERARRLLTRVGLEDREGDRIQKLSGGEMQRVAICRALLRRPRVLLADEPTGNLDDENSRTVMELMLELVREQDSSLIFVTHSQELARLADRTWTLHSGLLEVT